MPQPGTHKNFTDEQAAAWRREYDADDTLRVADMARRHEIDHNLMRTAMVWHGGALRSAGETRVARKKAGLV